MKNLKLIPCLVLAILMWGMSAGRAVAQKINSPENTVNAIEYRYQRFDKTFVTFADSVKFRDRIYNVFSAGVEADWERTFDLSTPMTGVAARVSLGYEISPVHAVEADFIFGNATQQNAIGANLNWVMNLNDFTARRDTRSRFETLFFAGFSYRDSGQARYGMNTGLRLQWNPGKNAGLFVEPKISVLSDPYTSRTFTTVPSVSFGLTLRYHKPDYYLWDYLTPLAIKTNMLYDALTAVNIGIEAPIRDHWSVAADWVSPWWSNYDKQRYFQLMYGNIEGRYWFGDREDVPQLTGWFAGVSVGGGIYDLMLNPEKGIQGGFQSYSAVAGYAHTIDKSGNLRLEYELGVGYLGTDYVKYFWDGYDYSLVAPSPQMWNTKWIGPTKVQVSLVYMLKIRSKVGGRE